MIASDIIPQLPFAQCSLNLCIRSISEQMMSMPNVLTAVCIFVYWVLVD